MRVSFFGGGHVLLLVVSTPRAKREDVADDTYHANRIWDSAAGSDSHARHLCPRDLDLTELGTAHRATSLVLLQLLGPMLGIIA